MSRYAKDTNGNWHIIAGTGHEAENVVYDNTLSGLTATNVQDAIDEKETAPTILTQTLTAGTTSLTFTNSAINNNSRVNYKSNPFTVGLIRDATQSGTTITLTCKAQSSDVDVMLEIYN